MTLAIYTINYNIMKDIIVLQTTNIDFVNKSLLLVLINKYIKLEVSYIKFKEQKLSRTWHHSKV
jgi:hypothetical protein